MPENTLEAFNKALHLGADFVELDVRQTKDNKCLVSHDAVVPGGFVISELPGHRLLRLAGERGMSLCYLEEVFEVLGNRVGINVEVKSLNDFEAFIRALKGYHPDKLIVSAFDKDLVCRFRQNVPAIACGLVADNSRETVADIFSRLGVSLIIQKFSVVDTGYVNSVHDHGGKIFVWTVDAKPDILAAADMGVDGIISNYPDRVREVLLANKMG